MNLAPVAVIDIERQLATESGKRAVSHAGPVNTDPECATVVRETVCMRICARQDAACDLSSHEW